MVGGDQGGCVQRMEVIVKRKKNEEKKTLRTLGSMVKLLRKLKTNFFYGGGGEGGQGIERRSEAFVKFQKKKLLEGGRGAVNAEVKLL